MPLHKKPKSKIGAYKNFAGITIGLALLFAIFAEGAADGPVKTRNRDAGPASPTMVISDGAKERIAVERNRRANSAVDYDFSARGPDEIEKKRTPVDIAKIDASTLPLGRLRRENGKEIVELPPNLTPDEWFAMSAEKRRIYTRRVKAQKSGS